MRWHVLTFALIVGAIGIAPSAQAGAAKTRPAGFVKVAEVNGEIGRQA